MQDQKVTLYVGAAYVSAFAISEFVALSEKEVELDIRKIHLTTPYEGDDIHEIKS